MAKKTKVKSTKMTTNKNAVKRTVREPTSTKKVNRVRSTSESTTKRPIKPTKRKTTGLIKKLRTTKQAVKGVLQVSSSNSKESRKIKTPVCKNKPGRKAVAGCASSPRKQFSKIKPKTPFRTSSIANLTASTSRSSEKRSERIAKLATSTSKSSSKKRLVRKRRGGKKAKTRPVLFPKAMPTLEYEVSKICDRKFKDGQEMFLVNWKGYSEEENTWEPLECLENASAALNDFLSRHDISNVEYICGARRVGGKQEYRVKWKRCPASGNTWEPRASLMKGASREVKRFEKVRKTRVA